MLRITDVFGLNCSMWSSWKLEISRMTVPVSSTVDTKSGERLADVSGQHVVETRGLENVGDETAGRRLAV